MGSEDEDIFRASGAFLQGLAGRQVEAFERYLGAVRALTRNEMPVDEFAATVAGLACRETAQVCQDSLRLAAGYYGWLFSLVGMGAPAGRKTARASAKRKT